jgi:hypothetical protein
MAVLSGCLAVASVHAQQKKQTAKQAAGVGDYPTDAAPWKDSMLAGRRAAFQAEIEKLMALPAEQVKPHPAAADFPGPTPSAAKPVAKTVSVDTSITGWHSTGLYAPAGKLITVACPPKAAGQRLEILMGCHTDKLWRQDITTWRRVPEITRAFPVDRAMIPAANAFGGLVYLRVPQNVKLGVIEVRIEGAIPAPHFVLGTTKPDQWRREIRLYPAPWAELECKHIVLSVPSSEIRDIDDPTAVLQLWDRLVKGQDDLAAKNDRTGKERMAFDRQISAGYMHSGHPIMCPLNEAKNAVRIELLSKGSWGFFHELGHNHQKPEWTPPGTGEVTCNIFSMYCMETYCGQPKTNHPAMAPDKRAERMRSYFKSGADFEQWKKDPFLALIMYYQLAEGFGWKPFTQVFAELRDLPAAQKPKTEPEKHEQFMLRFSKATGKNLGPFFRAWNAPVSDEAVRSLGGMPAWMPEPNFPAAYK